MASSIKGRPGHRPVGREHAESLDEALAPPSGRLPSKAAFWRALAQPFRDQHGCWATGNKVHYLGDVTLREDAGQGHTGRASPVPMPRTAATLPPLEEGD